MTKKTYLTLNENTLNINHIIILAKKVLYVISWRRLSGLCIVIPHFVQMCIRSFIYTSLKFHICYIQWRVHLNLNIHILGSSTYRFYSYLIWFQCLLITGSFLISTTISMATAIYSTADGTNRKRSNGLITSDRVMVDHWVILDRTNNIYEWICSIWRHKLRYKG